MRVSHWFAGLFLLAALLASSSNSADVMRRIVFQSAPSGAGMQIGDVIHVSKNADTSRASTITPAVDPDLQVTGVPAGHYKIQAYLNFTAGAGGSRVQSDISSAANLNMQGTRSCGSTITAVSQDESFNLICAGAAKDVFTLFGATDKPAATGTISVLWAQNTSNAAATVLESDSWFEVTRLN